MTTGTEAGTAASRKGQQMWDRDAGGTNLVLPVGCAAHALPQLGEVENLPIPESAVCPRQQGWDSSQPADLELLSHLWGQQLELVSTGHPQCDLPTGQAGRASGTGWAASRPAQPELLSSQPAQ